MAEQTPLVLETIPADIETSDYQELISWCRRLGLPFEGSADSLRNRLYEYYKISPQISAIKPDDAQNIRIESADNLEYFNIDKIDENYVRISGNVKVIIEKKSTTGMETHTITANEILFNFKQNYITATGDIKYSLTGEESNDNFRGDKITFNIKNLEGLFDEGVTLQNKAVSNKDISEEYDITFLFKGDEINKTSENFVLLTNGEITSCDMKNPHFKIKASKLWLLSNNEWAILNGLLYVGRIPVFYIPAFLYTGNELFFNPSFGYREDFGYFMQTTTYLIGKKDKPESTFSLLQAEDENIYYKLDGLFLNEDKNPSEEKIKLYDYAESGNYLKTILDFYSKAGFYAAVDLKLHQIEKLNPAFSFIADTDVFISCSFSRYTEDNGGVSSALFADENNEYKSLWLKSWIWNTPLPFRYGLDFSTGINLDWLNFNLSSDFWSDTNYKTDFFGRNENFDLFSLIDLRNKDAEDSSQGEINSSSTKIDFDFNPEIKALSPYLSNLKITAGTSLYFNATELNKSSGEYDEYMDYFFSPDNYIFPEFSVSANGNILPVKKTDAEQPDVPEKNEYKFINLRPPFEETEDYDSEALENNLPPPQDYIEIETQNSIDSAKIFTNTLKYSFTPSFSDKTQLSSSEWELPEDIDLEAVDYSFKNTSLSGNIAYDAKFYDKLFSVNNTIKLNYDKKEHYNMLRLPETTADQYELEDLRATETNIDNLLTLNSSPFAFIDVITNTKLTYNFNSLIYKYNYSDEDLLFVSEIFRNDENFIKQHKLDLNLPVATEAGIQTLNINSTLPPLTFKAAGSIAANYDFLNIKIDTSVYEDTESSEELIFAPLNLFAKINYSQNIWISGSISYDFNQNTFTQNLINAGIGLFDNNLKIDSRLVYSFVDDKLTEFKTGVNFYGFYLNYNAADTFDYEFNDVSGWLKSDETSFIPAGLTTGFSMDTGGIKFWKNRINLNLNVDSKLDFNLVRYTESTMTFTLGMNVNINEFMDFELKSSSENLVLYRYFPVFCEELGVSSLNMLDDLASSFDFFNQDKRYESNFNLKSISLGLVHDLHDWTLHIDYSGLPFVNEDDEDYPFYDWKSSLSIYMAWKAIPDIKTEMEIDNDDVTF